MSMNFDGEELMLMMLYNPGSRSGLMQELRLILIFVILILFSMATSRKAKEG